MDSLAKQNWELIIFVYNEVNTSCFVFYIYFKYPIRKCHYQGQVLIWYIPNNVWQHNCGRTWGYDRPPGDPISKSSEGVPRTSFFLSYSAHVRRRLSIVSAIRRKVWASYCLLQERVCRSCIQMSHKQFRESLANFVMFAVIKEIGLQDF